MACQVTRSSGAPKARAHGEPAGGKRRGGQDQGNGDLDRELQLTAATASTSRLALVESIARRMEKKRRGKRGARWPFASLGQKKDPPLRAKLVRGSLQHEVSRSAKPPKEASFRHGRAAFGLIAATSASGIILRVSLLHSNDGLDVLRGAYAARSKVAKTAICALRRGVPERFSPEQ